MKIILLDTVDKLGQKDEVKEVKKGYFRNFLFPRGLAKEATKKELAKIEQEKKDKETKKRKEIENLEKQAAELKDKKVNIQARLVAGRKLFGSIKADDIAEKLGLKTKQIGIKSPIKTAGKHKIIIDLGHDIKTQIELNIVSKKKKKS